MIGIWGAHASVFLVVIGITMIVLLLPMALWPLQWAKVIGWEIPADNRLAIYYGRCLGSVASAIGLFAIVASGDVTNTVFYFPVLLAAWVLMVMVHAWGAVRRIQPATESWEIIFWSGLAVVTLLFWPAAG